MTTTAVTMALLVDSIRDLLPAGFRDPVKAEAETDVVVYMFGTDPDAADLYVQRRLMYARNRLRGEGIPRSGDPVLDARIALGAAETLRELRDGAR